MTADEEGIRLFAADPSMVCLVDLTLQPDLFNRFTAPDQQIEFAVNTETLKKKVQNARKGDTLTFRVTRERKHGTWKHTLHVAITNDGVTTTFQVPELESDTEHPSTSDLEFDGTAIVAVDKLTEALKCLSGSVRFRLEPWRLLLESNDTEDGTQVQIVNTSDHLHAVELSGDPAASVFAAEYLAPVTKLRHTVERVTLWLGTDFPMQVTAEHNTYQWRYVVAPRIEDH